MDDKRVPRRRADETSTARPDRGTSRGLSNLAAMDDHGSGRVGRVVVASVAGIVVLAIAAAAFWFGPWRGDGDEKANDAAATTAVQTFARNWAAGTLAKSTYTPASGDVAASTAAIVAGLHAVGTGPKVTVGAVTDVTGESGSTPDEQRRRAALTVAWDLGPGHTWTYRSNVDVVEVPAVGDADPTWSVDWKPAVVEPSLQTGGTLAAARVPGARGRIVDGTGAPLTAGQTTVTIGIRKSRATDPEATARTVARLTGVDADALVAKVAAAGADQFVEVVTLDRAAYDKIRAEVQPLPGTVFAEHASDPVAVPSGYAASVLGTLGAATKEIADASDGAIVEGDTTGLSGLQASQNAVLGGTPGLTVTATPAAGGTAKAVKSWPAVDGKNLTITLDQKVQMTADRILKTSTKPASLVAIRVSTGEILAISNGSSSYNRALLGRYPPGSVFKIASTYALQKDSGLTPDTIVNCPDTITVGKVFRNAEGHAYGQVPFRTDFAKSCNTAFIGESKKITNQQLTDAAALLGYRKLDIGLSMFTASVPADGDATEHAAQMIGQGRVETTVLNVALASASIANGSSLQPKLITDPAQKTATAAPLDPTDVTEIRSMMRSVVTDGTGSSLASVGGGEVMAKTGTAEYGTESPPETHAWITGYQGDIAFAVVVEGGGFGGQVAGPLAASFLNQLAAGP